MTGVVQLGGREAAAIEHLGAEAVRPPDTTDQATAKRIAEIMAEMDDMDPDRFAAGPALMASDYSNRVLEHVTASELDGVHDKLVELQMLYKGLGADRLRKDNHGIVGKMMFSFQKELEKFRQRFESARTTVDRVVAQLEKDQRESAISIQTLANMGMEVTASFRELALHVEAGQRKLEEWRAQGPANPGAPDSSGSETDQLMDAMEQRRWQERLDHWDRVVTNLTKTRSIMGTTIPTVYQTLKMERVVMEELGTALTQFMPAIRQQIALFVQQARQGRRLENLKATREMTDEVLQQVAGQLEHNADMLNEQMREGGVSTDVLLKMMDDVAGSIERLDTQAKQAMAYRAESRAKLQDATRSFADRVAKVAVGPGG
ncbi:toxic anion resistance protein [uncultured Rhodospira sp.]|uniref:toxic anion resistance protein n=1 Tax=uncultured Rhodospira sp. TaxID=1936189 RepID=UPI002604BF72|nr:toxic anion resistance protein [uncultured Rhodospira sp.]